MGKSPWLGGALPILPVRRFVARRKKDVDRVCRFERVLRPAFFLVPDRFFLTRRREASPFCKSETCPLLTDEGPSEHPYESKRSRHARVRRGRIGSPWLPPLLLGACLPLRV
jgi:hypothetical protein